MIKTKRFFILSLVNILITEICALTSEIFVYKYENLDKIILHNNKSNKYLLVSGKNYILQFSENNLSEPSAVRKIGPVNHSVICTEPNQCPTSLCSKELIIRDQCRVKLTDVFVKSWTIAKSDLVVCYDVFQGFCEIIDLYNQFSSSYKSKAYSIVTNDRKFHSTILYLRDRLYFANEVYPPSNYREVDFNTMSILTFPNMSQMVPDYPFQTNFGKLVSPKEKTIFPLEFKGSFHIHDTRNDVHFKDYIFYLINQPENKHEPKNGQFQVRLVRICSFDDDFTSFIDIGMNCDIDDQWTYYQVDSWIVVHVSDNMANWYRNKTRFTRIKKEMDTDFNQILFINFKIIRITNNYKETLNSFVTCAYPIAEIMELYDVVRNLCLEGKGSINEEPYNFKSTDRRCMEDDYSSNKKGECGGKNFNKIIIGDHYGENSIIGHRVISKDGLQGHSLVVFSIYEKFTLAMIGGNDGNLYKYELFEDTNYLFSTDNLFHNSTFNMVLNENKSVIYAVADSKIIRHNLRNCYNVTNCEDCLVLSPFCGWCISVGKCIVKDQCTSAMWLPFQRNRTIKACPLINLIPSHRISEYSNKSPTVIFQVSKTLLSILSENEDFLKCKFTLNNNIEIANVKAHYFPRNHSLSCSGPQGKNLPPIDENKNFVDLKLKVLINESHLVEGIYYIYNCGHSKTCSHCVKNKFNCSWCVLDNSCVSSSMGKCKKNFEIQNNQQDCPSLEISNETLAFHVGSSISIALKTKNFRNYFNSKTDFVCLETCDNSTAIGSLSASNGLMCTFKMMKVLQNGIIKCSMKVSWILGNLLTGSIETQTPIEFQVFDCQKLSEHCDDCVHLPQIYKCGFCSTKDKCVQKHMCENDESKWINSKFQKCPLPSIMEIVPSNSTLSSESVILIKGRNLGFYENDVKNAITLENNRFQFFCKYIEQSYISSKQFKCKIQNINDRIETPVTFQFKFKTKEKYLVSKEFKFYTPSVYSIEPNFGPFIGGTIIKVNGSFLNIGSRREVKFNYGTSSIACNILENRENYILCRLNDFDVKSIVIRVKRSSNPKKASLQLIIDANSIQFTDIQFEFFPNPHVKKISKNKFLSNGGQMFKITGDNLNRLNNPSVAFRCETFLSIYENCLVNNSDIDCISPTTSNITQPQKCSLLFSMEKGSVSVYNTTITVFSTPILRINPNKISLPTKSFSFTKPKLASEKVTINLELNDQISVSAFYESDFKIFVGPIICSNISFFGNNIRCNIIQVNQIDIYHKYQISLLMGKNVLTVSGYIQFEKGDISLDTVSVIIITSILIVILICVILVAIIIVKKVQSKQKLKHEKENIFSEKIIKEANEVLKKGIAELNQAAIQDEIHKNWNAAPIHPYNVYILYNLFPNTHPRLYNESKHMNESILDLNYYKYNSNDPSSHPLIFNRQIPVIENTVEYSRKLSKLFEDELFVLMFFTFLEDHQEVESKKSDIVSFLSLILMKDLPNYTRILKILIKNDYDKKKLNDEERSMFRQSDLLSKLLSNWFFILMYEHLQNINAGGDLLILYLNILNIINKGPVNFETSKSQYALNEHSLLDRKTEFNKLNLKVKHEFFESDDELLVEVLDCDCISQAKLKIFEEIHKYSPYSHWPNLENYCLIKLNQDEDPESERLLASLVLKELVGYTFKTLKDYDIKDGDNISIAIKNESIPASNTASVSHFESNSASLKTNKSRNISKDVPMTTFFPEISKRIPIHRLSNSVHETPSHKSKLKCCYKTKTKAFKDGHDVKPICLIYTQVLKSRIENQIKNLFDDIFDYESVPLCVSDLFTHFNNICKDDSIVFAVKSNSLILRFWIQLINNIDFLFDIPLVKHTPVLECLKCVSRVLMDICSENQNKDVWLTQLFSDVIKLYSPKVLNYYDGIKSTTNSNYNDYYGSSRIEGINISLAIVILYQNYINSVHRELVEVIQSSNYPIDKQNEWITILEEVKNLYVAESFLNESNGEIIKTSIC